MTLYFQLSEMSDSIFNGLTRTLYGCWTEALFNKAIPGIITMEHLRTETSAEKRKLFRTIPAVYGELVRITCENETASIASIGVEEFCEKNGLTFRCPVEPDAGKTEILRTVVFKL